jgi:hypothetical protein
MKNFIVIILLLFLFLKLSNNQKEMFRRDKKSKKPNFSLSKKSNKIPTTNKKNDKISSATKTKKKNTLKHLSENIKNCIRCGSKYCYQQKKVENNCENDCQNVKEKDYKLAIYNWKKYCDSKNPDNFPNLKNNFKLKDCSNCAINYCNHSLDKIETECDKECENINAEEEKILLKEYNNYCQKNHPDPFPRLEGNIKACILCSINNCDKSEADILSKCKTCNNVGENEESLLISEHKRYCNEKNK